MCGAWSVTAALLLLLLDTRVRVPFAAVTGKLKLKRSNVWAWAMREVVQGTADRRRRENAVEPSDQAHLSL